MLYALKRTDGGVTILTTVGDATPEDCIAKWPEADRAAVVSIDPIDPADIPQDRTFRDAWTLDGRGITHDMPKARDIQRERMRRARSPKLEALDVAYQRADEAGDAAEKRRVGARKQALRDVTTHPSIDAAKTPEELKQAWPAELRE